jgi:hypothetical protein
MAGLETAIRYPMESDDWLKTVAIGGVLLILSFLVLPAIAVYGYLVTVIRDSLNSESDPPTFENWGGLLRNGVFALIIGLVYLLIPIIVGALTIGGTVAALATGSQSGQAAAVAGPIGGFALSAVLTLVFGYFAVIGLVNFARTDEFTAAFDVGTISQVAMDRNFFVAWLLSVVVLLVAGLVISLLNVVPILGTIVGAFVFFYADVVAAYLWADGFGTAYVEDRPDHTGIEDPAV